MSGQTSLNNGRVETGSTRSVVGNAADVVSDITELVELQGKLFVADLKSTGRRAAFPIGLIVVGLCVLLGLVPVLLLGVAELLVVKAEVARFAAMLVSAACGAAFCAVMFAVGWLLLRKSFRELANSQHEFKRNLNWVKHTLRNARSASRTS